MTKAISISTFNTSLSLSSSLETLRRRLDIIFNATQQSKSEVEYYQTDHKVPSLYIIFWGSCSHFQRTPYLFVLDLKYIKTNAFVWNDNLNLISNVSFHQIYEYQMPCLYQYFTEEQCKWKDWDLFTLFLLFTEVFLLWHGKVSDHQYD